MLYLNHHLTYLAELYRHKAGLFYTHIHTTRIFIEYDNLVGVTTVNGKYCTVAANK